MRQRPPLRRQIRPRPRDCHQTRLAIETGRGVLTVDLDIADGKADRVRVDMGAPILTAADIPTTLPGSPVVDAQLDIGGEAWAVTVVSTGNPHAVVYVAADFLTTPGDQVAGLGPKIERHPAFPGVSTSTSSPSTPRMKSRCAPGSVAAA